MEFDDPLRPSTLDKTDTAVCHATTGWDDLPEIRTVPEAATYLRMPPATVVATAKAIATQEEGTPEQLGHSVMREAP